MNKEEAIKILQGAIKKPNTKDGYLGQAIDMAIQALSQEPKIGKWIIHPKGIYAHLVCDKCLSHAPYDCRTNYCPNCGAKMESEDKND